MIQELFDLTGKKAIVTGGSRGIGRAMATALHEFGAEVVVVGTSDKVMEAANEIGASGAKVHGVRMDIGDRVTLEEKFNECVKLLGGRVDILINDAAADLRRFDSLNYPPEDIDRMLNVNVAGLFQLCQYAGRIMVEQRYGKIINVISIAAIAGSSTGAFYSGTKGAVQQITKSLSNEWAKYGVHVNAIAPGYTQTDMAAESLPLTPERKEFLMGRIPLKRFGDVKDFYGVTVFLASDASDYVTGATITVDGGAVQTCF